MKNLFLIIFFISIINPVVSQKYYDSNDLKYYIDFSNRNANLKFQDYKINGPIEEIISYYGNRYTVIKGDSIHWLLQQSDKRNKHLSYILFKGDYDEVQKLAKWEYSNKKLEVLTSDRIFSGYFKDYFNFVDEGEYLKLSSDRLIGDYIKDAGLIGEYKIKIYRDNGVNYFDLNIEGVLKLTRKGVIIETNLLKNEIEVAEFGVYEPLFGEEFSEKFKLKIKEIQEKQKMVITNGKAIVECVDWKVNGTIAEGEKMISVQKKLMLKKLVMSF
mgnify:CR=1 FL=1